MDNGNLKPCKPGETHNPNGRPKGSKNFKTILKRYLQAKIKMDKDSPFVKEGEEITAKDALMLKLITLGMKGNLNAIDKIVTRFDGMPMQNVTMKSDNKIDPKDKQELITEIKDLIDKDV